MVRVRRAVPTAKCSVRDRLNASEPRNTENHQAHIEETKDAADDKGDEGEGNSDIKDEIQTQTDDAETEASITNNEIPISLINEE
jgi:hypothetical protein